MKIAVTGSYSYSGKYITRRLLAQGAEVITLTGHPDRPNAFDGKVKAFPLDFDSVGLVNSLKDVEVLYNTYWVRFDHGANTQAHAVENTFKLIKAASEAGVKRIVHISITNPSLDSKLPYFQGKAQNEQAVQHSGLSYAILRPTVLFGIEDILINNIAYLLRHFPVFGLPGNGNYRLQPIFVDDLARLAVEAGESTENLLWDAVGPDTFSFKELVGVIGQSTGYQRPLLSLPPRMALFASQAISLLVGDVLLTQDEIDGLSAGLLVSSQTPRATTHLADWLNTNKATVGTRYASELKRHYL